jgi:hypothetical protein
MRHTVKSSRGKNFLAIIKDSVRVRFKEFSLFCGFSRSFYF